jgi:formamidopyrimidine-DNA glycosylase
VPELPEVEVTRLSFASRIAGAKVHDVHVGKPLRWPFGVGLIGGAQEAVDALSGAVVQGVRRRGKYLLVDLLHHAKPGLLIIHLGMSGSLLFSRDLPAAGKHDHFSLITSHGELRLNDPRRFGAVIFAYSETDSWPRKLLDGLGVEPLTPDFEPAGFHAALKKRHAPIKQVLLAGDIVVGVGNIYASEQAEQTPRVEAAPSCGASAASGFRKGRQHAARLFERKRRERLFSVAGQCVWPRG